MSDRVIILGGGVGGLSAAHELVERGFRVTVYEKGNTPGGKARSFGVPNTGKNGRRDLPAEHGFRFFPGFYRHLPDTMKRIPFGAHRSVFDNLVDTTEMQLLFQGKQHLVVPSRFPRSLADIRAVLDASGYLTTATGLTGDDIQFYCQQVWRLLTSCEERRAAELEIMSWWDYIDARARSEIYQDYLGRTPRVLVAADPEEANTKTVGDIMLQLLFNLGDPGVAADRVLNGPTNDVWIEPWLTYLETRGVDYRVNTPVIGLRCADGRIAAVRVLDKGTVVEDMADYYVAALPAERMAALITQDMTDIDPTLENIKTLAGHVDWMAGIQFYFQVELPSICGHQMFLSSPWALTSLSQAQFWYDDASGFARDFGDGTVFTVLSVDVSDWTQTRGLNGKFAIDCSRHEVANEVWDQLSANLSGLKRTDLHPTTPWHLDPAIQPGNGRLTNAEPLLVNRPDSWRLRPWAQTHIPNLFLAADYVRTHTNLATMEAANEAARRAVNGIIEASGARAARCQVWNLHEPVWVKAWRAWDLVQYRSGRSWSPELPDLVIGAARAVLESAPSVGGSDDYADFGAREAVTWGIGLVPPYVQDELADLVSGLGSAFEQGNLAAIRAMFALDAVIVLNGARGLDQLSRFYAEGGRMEVDIRRLESIRPEGRRIAARFVANVTVVGEHRARSGRLGRLQVTLARAQEQEPRTTPAPWLISSFSYEAGV